MPIDLRAESFWDADFPNGFGGAAQANNDAIASFTDNGTKGNTLTQATGANKPTYKTAIVNGHNVMRFVRASSQFLSVASSAANNYVGSMTLFSLNAIASEPIGVSYAALSVDNGVGFGGWKIGTFNDASMNQIVFTTYGQADYPSGVNDYSALDTFLVESSNFVDNSSAEIYKNGALEFTGGASTMGSSGTQPLRMSGTELWDGDIHSVIWFWRALDRWEMNLVHQFLLNKIALT